MTYLIHLNSEKAVVLDNISNVKTKDDIAYFYDDRDHVIAGFDLNEITGFNKIKGDEVIAN